ncbi:MAG: pyridoxamine 5'-phosphate oxidase family protein [Rhodobacteraceae bacterium]|nr:pyridoxamine 5'-phosphate oxidase family protein [Paracoccaceae bacterium]
MPLGKKLNGTLRAFIENQPVFFVSTAAETGRVNVSPKGADTLRIIDDNRIMWLNLSGSGNETAGHIRACNRMTLMFCAFTGDALILRLYGQATVIHPRDNGWADAISAFPKLAGSRQVFNLTIDGVQTSCGFGVPVMTFESDRLEEELTPVFAKMGPEGVRDYWQRRNAETIDGFATGIAED